MRKSANKQQSQVQTTQRTVIQVNGNINKFLKGAVTDFGVNAWGPLAISCDQKKTPVRKTSDGVSRPVSASRGIEGFRSRSQACCLCCNLPVGVALNVRFTTNGMCAKNKNHMYLTRRSNNSVIAAHDLYCYLLPQCGA